MLLLGALTSGTGEGVRAVMRTPTIAVSPFTEITARVEQGQRVNPWPDGTFSILEIMGPGVGLLDYDGDGDLDLLQLRVPPPGRPDDPAPNRLLEQFDDGRFVDSTERSGLGDPGFAQGLAVGDVNNDGRPDVYLANYGRDALYLNDGDGRFRNVTTARGIEGDLWSTAATFCDYDRDGDLDLYVGHYLAFDRETVCLGESGTQDFCGPANFPGVADKLLRNRGDGVFEDVTAEAGLMPLGGWRRAKALGVVCTDLTDDGLADFYVANDGEDNFLWVNQGDGTFEEQALLRGVAVNQYGNPESSMGVAVGDVDASGTLDLFMTHIEGQTNTLYAGLGRQLFEDGTTRAGMAARDLALTGFGCGFFDYDHDADLDLAVANGRIYRGRVLPGAELGDFWNAYAEPNLLFANDGRGRFQEIDDGDLNRSVEVSRAMAFGDIDADGDIDLVVSNLDNTLRMFRNDAPPPGSHWLMVRVLTGLRDALGAEVTVRLGDVRLRRPVLSGYSYMSSNDPRAHFGLGSQDHVDQVEVLWPDGSREVFPVEGVDREIALTQGTGRQP